VTLGRHWGRACALEDIVPETGVCALVGEEQVALFRVADAVFAIGNHDPMSGANVLSRGLVGSLEDELVVASPLYKHHYSLLTGRCLEEPDRAVPVYQVRILDRMVWVRERAAERRAHPSTRRLVVVGNGMAANRVLEHLCEIDPKAFDITVFGAEPHGGYNRVMLSPFLAGDAKRADVVTHPPEWFAARGITFHMGDPVVRIDRVRRRVHSTRGQDVPYDRLLVATGAEPVTLRLPGANLPGVIAFRSLTDVERMLERARSGGRAVVIGGGLLGLEAASGLARRGMAVTVVHLQKSLMEQQLDEPAAALLQTALEGRGVSIRLEGSSAAIVGSDRVTGLRLEDGTAIPADLLVMAVGVRPRIELAREAGLQCRRGILVDDTLQTFDPSIYAVGECVEHRQRTFGLVAPVWDQARVCALHLTDRGVARFRGASPATRLKVSGIEVFSAGDFQDRKGRDSVVLRDAQGGIYKRLVLEDDRIKGAVLYGDTLDAGWYAELIRDGRDVASFRDRLLFGQAECEPPP
jgi:NAD(P)H-dependent nitrite reductase small subunit